MAALEQCLLALDVEAPNIVAAFQLAWDALRGVLGLTHAQQWQTLDGEPCNESDLPGLFDRLATSAASADAPLSIDANLGASMFNSILVHGRGEGGGRRWHVDITLDGTAPLLAFSPWRPTALLAEVARALFRSGTVLAGRLDVGNAAVCVPSVPLAFDYRTLLVTTADEVAKYFERPEALWESWSSQDARDPRAG
jgi:hypothetical protein